KMKMDVPAYGATIDMEIKKATPGKYFMEMSMGGQTAQKVVVNGNTGKSSGMTGNKTLDEEEIAEMKDEMAIIGDLDYKTSGNTYKLLGIESNMYKVETTSSEGDKSYDYYSVETGLKMMTIATSDSPQGKVAVSSKILDYIEVDGIKFPETVETVEGPQAYTLRMVEAKVNPELDDNAFN